MRPFSMFPMTTQPWKLLAAVLIGWSAAPIPSARGALYSVSPGVPVPDGNASGLVSSLIVPADVGRVVGVEVGLNLPGDGLGGWNGDLYLMLSHGGTTSVLLNRVGRTASDAFGYGDNGFVGVRFTDAAGRDIHGYQADAGYVPFTDLPIAGDWQPDARSTDPGVVLDSDLRGLPLGQFNGHDAGGEWRLFVADLSPGGTFRLQDWSISLVADGSVIPEPGMGWALGGLLLSGATFSAWRKRRAGTSR